MIALSYHRHYHMETNLSTHDTPPSTGRIEFIDALRGFVMIVVVMHHVDIFSLNVGAFSFNHIWMQIQMPTFFFISGFCAYKANTEWDLRNAGTFLSKKIPMLIIGTSIFLILFTQYRDMDLYIAIFAQFKGGYWYTYTLFLFYVFYVILCLFTKRYQDIIFILAAIAVYMGGGPNGYISFPLPEKIKGFLCMQQWHYFFYFLIGALAHKHYSLLRRGLDNRYIISTAIVLFCVLNLYPQWKPTSGIPFRIVHLTQITSGVLILFSFFRNRQSFFSERALLGRSLQYVGKRTLDVYFIHYFLIPFNLSQITSTLLKEFPMPIIDLMISFILSLAIVGVSLLAGNIIRLSPFLAYWTFGQRNKK